MTRTRTNLSRALSLAAFLLGPVLSYALVEYLNGNNPWTYFTALQVLLNLCWYYILFFLIYLAVGRLKLAAGIGAGLFYIFGTVNHYVYAFRGRTLFPADLGLSSLRTAANVSGGYDYTPDTIQLITFAVLAVYIAALILLPRQHGRHMPRWWLSTAAGVLAVGFLGMFFFTDTLKDQGIRPSMWTTRGNGLMLNFCLALSVSHGEEPEDYSAEAVAEAAQAARAAAAEPAAVSTQPVNLIVIMNESFADLGVYGDLGANQDWMPYYRSLRENCVKGTAMSSVFGGTTANSEYEFLTGNSMFFFPEGTVPYQLYVNETSSSLVEQLEAQGYRSVAMHPYLPSGWNRPAVYRDFGFDTVLFKDDFQNRSFMRNYVTDRCDYENLIRIYEEKTPGEKLFLFNVTMQNHSAYNVAYNGLPRTVWLDGTMEGYFPTVDQYLSLMKQSDLALEYLIDYFSQIEEPTMILLFGDHQPQVATGFFELMLGGKLGELSLTQQQKRQQVPYLIWTNYDIPESAGQTVSLNCLASLLLEQAGLELTDYQRFLLTLSRELPVINALGLRTADGMDYGTADALPEDAAALLRQYEILQYCNVFDPDSAPADFFQ